MKTRSAILSLAFWLPAALAWAAPTLTHVDVFTSGQDGYHTYRIPGIEVAPDGSLLAFAEARKYNRSDPGTEGQDIDLVMKRSADGGMTWSSMTLIEDPGELWSAANPATIVDRQTGRVWLFYIRCKPNSRKAAAGSDAVRNLARWSEDNGKTWSEPMDLTAVARDMNDRKEWRASVIGPGGAIQTAAGRLVAAVWRTAPYGVFTVYSDDHGRTWQRGEEVPGENLGDENQVAELDDGRILMDIRQHNGTHRWLSTSRDGGKTWSKPRPGVTVSPVCCAIERYPLGLVWTGPKGPGRANLVMRVSRDQGKTFTGEQPIYQGYAAYSDLAVLPDRAVGVLWERGVKTGYQFISFTRVPAERLSASGAAAR